MSTMTATTTQVYQLFIRATPEQIWDAITKPEFTAQYFYGARITVTPEHYEALAEFFHLRHRCHRDHARVAHCFRPNFAKATVNKPSRQS